MSHDLTTDAVREPAFIASVESRSENRLRVLDGWRALSILMVLAAHLFPLGPKAFKLNDPVPAGGMAIFFTLSGFLITRFLLDRPEPVSFLIRCLLRITWAVAHLSTFYYEKRFIDLGRRFTKHDGQLRAT